jgi:ATP-dependent RNA helicase DeaD
MTNPFEHLGLNPHLVQTVAERGYTDPTPIQSEVIPLLLAGNDVIGRAQTGTGKTAAFALPILDALPQGERDHIAALVLAPTRELAMQVARAFQTYGRYLGVRVLPLYGGQSYDLQIRRLRQGVDVVVGTPGRLIDLMQRGLVNLQQVRTVVLDEADEMLSMGFVEDIEKILAATPPDRQTALFSATLPAAIRSLADRYMRNPQSVMIEQRQMTVAAIEQRYYVVNSADRVAALTRLFESETIDRAIVFARTRVSTGDLAGELKARGYSAEFLSGDLSQEARTRVLQRFRDGQLMVLVATDVAARGLDIDGVTHVFNFELPDDLEMFVHRIGRTGRAGQSGLAITLITPRELWRLHRLEKFTRQPMTRAELPTVDEIVAKRDKQLLEQMEVWLRRGRARAERLLAEQLIEKGYEPTDVAAAALKLARAEEKQRPIASISPVEELRPPRTRPELKRPQKPLKPSGKLHVRERSAAGPQSHEPGMARLVLDIGRKHGVKPADIVGTIAYTAQIPGRSLGAIHIEPEQTFVDVPDQFAEQVLAQSGNYRIHRRPVNVSG